MTLTWIKMPKSVPPIETSKTFSFDLTSWSDSKINKQRQKMGFPSCSRSTEGTVLGYYLTRQFAQSWPSGKLIQKFCRNFSFTGATRTDFWKILPVFFSKFQFPGHELDRSMENSSKIEHMEKILEEFSRKRSVSRPVKLKFGQNFWMSFPGFANKG